jgi:hypothetical protein
MGLDAGEPTFWAVSGCLFEVSLPETADASWRWADPRPEVTLLDESVRGDQRHFRFRAEAESAGAAVALRFRGRTSVGAVVIRSVTVRVAPEKPPTDG